MKELKTKRKTTHSIFRMIKLNDIPVAAALFFVSRACVLGGRPMAVPFFAAICDPAASYIYLPTLILGSISSGANAVKYFLASFLFWLISELRVREAHKFTNALYCGGLVFLSGITDI